MSQTICRVKDLEKLFSKEELSTTCNDMYLRSISACRCAVHINDMPVMLPTINELHKRICQDIFDLFEWSQNNMNEDKSGKCVALLIFIKKYCLDSSPDSLLCIIESLERTFSTKNT